MPNQMNAAKVIPREQIRNGCFAVRVRSRSEDAVSGALRQKGFEVFHPTFIDRKRCSGRSRRASQALFPGYIFVRVNPKELLGLVTTRGVSYVVKSGNTLRPLPPEEESTIRSLCDMVDRCEPFESFCLGERVTIQSGPLKGRTGTLISMDGKDRIVLSLNSIFRSVSIDLRDTIVGRCEAEPPAAARAKNTLPEAAAY
jgi:transcriptional antiterminator RfaH